MKLELHKLTATKLPLASKIYATKIVPVVIYYDGITVDCPTLTMPIQAPTKKDVALKLPTVIPVTPNSWLAILAKLGKFWNAVPSSTCQKLVLLLKFPPVPLCGVNTAMYNVSLEFEVPNDQFCV